MPLKLLDFTLFNTRWLYLSRGNPLGMKGLRREILLEWNIPYLIANLAFLQAHVLVQLETS